LVFLVPLITGTEPGSSALVLGISLALALSSVPVLACGAAGVLVVLRRRIRVGDRVEVAGRRGRVAEITLLELRLTEESGTELSIPHLFRLLQPSRVLRGTVRTEVEIAIDPKASQTRAREILLEVAQRLGREAEVDLVSIDADGACYTIGAALQDGGDATALLSEVAERLTSSGIGLGRASARERTRA
jgi:small-conductance mechanosensitive channel